MGSWGAGAGFFRLCPLFGGADLLRAATQWATLIHNA